MIELIQAKDAFPRAAEDNKQLFLNYVLPYCCANENRDAWRENFFQRFAPVVAGMCTRDAVAKLNTEVQPSRSVYSCCRCLHSCRFHIMLPRDLNQIRVHSSRSHVSMPLVPDCQSCWWMLAERYDTHSIIGISFYTR